MSSAHCPRCLSDECLTLVPCSRPGVRAVLTQAMNDLQNQMKAGSLQEADSKENDNLLFRPSGDAADKSGNGSLAGSPPSRASMPINQAMVIVFMAMVSFCLYIVLDLVRHIPEFQPMLSLATFLTMVG